MGPSDYVIAPVLANEEQRQAAVRAAMCSFVPREERFDRITRMAQRLMHVPIALISIIDDDVQFFRSVQGLGIDQTARSISFCGHAIVTDQVFQVPNALQDPRFANNPLVLGPPHIRSYCGWPLELAPGLRAGTLCVIDTMPRTFSEEDIELMADLAHMAESELRVNMMADRQKSLLLESSRATRQSLLDAETGTWSERGFLELLRRTLLDVKAGKINAAMVAVRIRNFEEFGEVKDEADRQARAILISQLLRQRLPANAVLCRLPGGRALVLLAHENVEQMSDHYEQLQREPQEQSLAGVKLTRALDLACKSLVLQTEHEPQELPVYVDQVFKLLDQKIQEIG